MAKERIIDRLMGELCLFGGLLATRFEVLKYLNELYRERGEDPGEKYLFIQTLMWMPPRATEEEAAWCRANGMTWADELKRMPDPETRE